MGHVENSELIPFWHFTAIDLIFTGIPSRNGTHPIREMKHAKAIHACWIATSDLMRWLWMLMIQENQHKETISQV